MPAKNKGKTYKVKPTAKQKKLVQNLLENTSTQKEAMIKAGYSPETAKVPSKIMETKGVQLAAEPYVEELKRARQEALAEIRAKNLEKVQYSDLSNAIAKMTTQIELLEGRDTSKQSIEFKWKIA